MSGKRRNVKFNHRGSTPGENRRPSASDLSEGYSEPGSPTRNGDISKSDVIMEEVRSHMEMFLRPFGLIATSLV